MPAWSFTATCPAGHRAVQDAFDRETLRALVRDSRPIRLRCIHCGVQWDATDPQRESIAFAVAHAN